VFIELCKRSVNNQVTRPPHFQTKIDIGKHFRQAFIETADFLKSITPRPSQDTRLINPTEKALKHNHVIDTELREDQMPCPKR